MKDYYFKQEKFIIENYLHKSTFSNFLPGLAGKKGIPLWTFYVNRGQGISGFGLQDKNHPIMAFTPANKAYESVGQIGFRTFMKVNGKYYEPFLSSTKHHHRMYIERTSFEIEETNKDLGVRIHVKYFGLPNENIGALIRRVKITNISNQPLDLEILDGIAEILPSGVQNGAFREMSNLLCSWMDVEELEQDYAFYKLRSSTGDSSEVTTFENGNYLFGLVNGQMTKPITDQEIVFGYDSMKLQAVNFIEKGVQALKKEKQITVNKIPCGFIPVMKKLQPKEELDIDVVSGFSISKEFIRDFMKRAKDNAYLDNKEAEAKKVIDELVNDVVTDTGNPVFNEYVKQSYLDNLLRGGYPYKIGNTIYHLYSRRHGDLERDYNFFSLTPEFYSQGGGNFRDVCQNRRMDSFVHKEVDSYNIKHFASLIQLDGYNPLTINGPTFTFANHDVLEGLLLKHFEDKRELVRDFLQNKYTPGGLVNFIYNNQIQIKTNDEELLDEFISNSKKHIESAFGEGYWSDHFTYIIDMVETYESIYPDKMKNLLFKENDILTFESPVTVLEKTEKSVINKSGQIRQYGSLRHFDEEKIGRLNLDRYGSNWVKLGNQTYQTNLFTKLMILTLTKHSLLDPEGLGVEMEGNKPGWNDAMNGVPGLFGSGISETIELKRIVMFLLKHLEAEEITLPKEVFDLFQGLSNCQSYEERLYHREEYRRNTRFGLRGEIIHVNYLDVVNYLKTLNHFIDQQLNSLYEENNQIVPTFITYDVTKHENLMANNHQIIGHYGLPLVKPLQYRKRYLPNFLEAPTRLLKVDFEQDKLRKMVQAIKKSDIYDKTLKIYKTSGALENEDYEIGRIRAFTKGWLERESDFLHMIYKYLLGLLKAGLYEEFYEEMKHNFVCFMDPEVYGRNTLENSSFIAPSNNPNPKIHGKGFLPRLTGSTVEVIEAWAMMMTGGHPFKMKDGKLIFAPRPLFSKEFFKANNTVTYRFMKQVDVTYISDNAFNTYESCHIVKMELFADDAKEVIYQDYIEETQAKKIRDGLYKEIRIYIKKNI